jgi:tRNA C32,U32 (ribose-2'-O)-methylase TrmJ
VAAYELRLALTAGEAVAEELAEELATGEEMEGFYRHLEQTLYRTEFLDPAYPKKLMSRLRRMFARARPRKDEANILRGILTAVDKAIKS